MERTRSIRSPQQQRLSPFPNQPRLKMQLRCRLRLPPHFSVSSSGSISLSSHRVHSSYSSAFEFPVLSITFHFCVIGEQKGIIVNGASSSVGSYAVQLAKRAGLFVIGVAGSSKDYAKELGADVIVDYREHKGEALVSTVYI